MNGTNCPNCDRADCPMLSCSAVRGTMASNRAMADCANHTVDWRARALAAEARIAAACDVANRYVGQSKSADLVLVAIAIAADAVAKSVLAALEPKP